MWEFSLGMVILCVSRVRLPATAASCTFAVFAVQKAVLLISDGPEGCGCLGSFCSGFGAFSRRDFSHRIPRKSGTSSFVGLRGGEASMVCVGTKMMARLDSSGVATVCRG